MLPPLGQSPPKYAPEAAFCDSPSTLSLLVEARAEVDARDRHGQSPIFFAGTPEICSQLEAARADVSMRNRRGQSALHHAASAGLDEVGGTKRYRYCYLPDLSQGAF